ncbi:ATP-binding protein [Candidatus Villigracilis affinis]|uniref:ATP-binding protein n=1 Tax=Candidatus Villigracilis affinis TaxID=3140682 RepID=UPI002A1D4207|nr:cyclic nucleotide-binding domain-containing protein [Anaerolineales bacterium]
MAGKKSALDPEVLRKFSFFASFSRDQLEEIARTAPKAACKMGEVVFRQGDRSATMYLILKGAVKIEREDSAGGIISVGQLSTHQVFGELAMLSKEPRQATVTVTKNAEFLVIDRKMMLSIIAKSAPEEIIEVFSVLSEQTRAANDREFKETLSRRTIEAQMEVEKQRALTQLVAGVAHEINTPLGVINTAVSIMARELAEPREITTQRAADIAESLELMRRNVERAHRLVQDFKKVSVSQLMDEKDTFDISEAIKETVDLVMVSLKRNQIQVKFHDKLSPNQKKWTGYRGFLSQILINLLTNIERYAYPNGSSGSVDVKIELENDTHYRLSVTDYGKGIAREHQTRIFEPFFTTGRSVGGSGLGLTIVHNLVKNAMKGEIRLTSEVGKGTTFKIILPKVIVE